MYSERKSESDSWRDMRERENEDKDFERERDIVWKSVCECLVGTKESVCVTECERDSLLERKCVIEKKGALVR